MKKVSSKVTVIVPIHNEEENLEKLVKKIRRVVKVPNLEIFLVYDESEDKTLEIAERLSDHENVRLIMNPYQPGFGWSLRAGLETVDEGHAVPIMADLCDELEDINRMYKKARSGYDVICGSRYMKGGSRQGGPIFKSFFSYFIGVSLHYLTGIPTKDCTNAFKMYSKEVISAIPLHGEKSFAISMQAVLSAYFRDFSIGEIPTTWQSRSAGKTGFNIRKLGIVYFKTFVWGLIKGLKVRFFK